MRTNLFLVLTTLWIASSQSYDAHPVSLSPSMWDAETFRRLEAMLLRKNPRPKPLEFSKDQGIVSGTTSVLSVHAGTEALRKGGNAMDACIATAMADIPLTAGSEISFAGVTNLLYYDHVTGRTHNLDAGWKIPKPKNLEQKLAVETLGDSVLVPGLLAGMHEAAEFSKFPLRTLLEPALYFAEKGFKMPHRLGRTIQKYYKKTLRQTKEGKDIFTNQDTRNPYKPGELFRQPQLAEFIRNIQRYGKQYMYQGNWTRKAIETINKHGGRMTFDDMAQYEAQWREPASTLYNGYHVTTSESKWGGVELIEMLNLLKLAHINSTDNNYLTNATKLLYLMSVTRYSHFISDFLYSKSDSLEVIDGFFGVDASPSGRMDYSSASDIWTHLCNDEGRAMINEYMKELLSEFTNFDANHEYKRGSSAVVAMDNAGNICALSHTANSRPWGTGLFVDGVALPHSGAVLQNLLLTLRPGSHVPSGLQPVIIFKEKVEKQEIPVRVSVKPVRVTAKTGIPARATVQPVKEKRVKPVTPNVEPSHEEGPDIGPIIGPRGVWELETNDNPIPSYHKPRPKRKRRNLMKEIQSLDTRKVPSQHSHGVGGQYGTEEEHSENIKETEEKDDSRDVNEKEDRPVESHTIGGFYTETDLNSIFEKNSPQNNYRRLKESRKRWFKNFVRQIFQSQMKTGGRRKKMKISKTRNKRWAQPHAALAVIGQSAPEVTLQYISNLIDNRMGAKQISDAPMFFSSSPGSSRQDVRIERFIFSDDVINDVRSRGQEVKEVMHKVGRVISGKGAVLTVTDKHQAYGCSHPDSEGFAESQ